tara:strand:+ start:307 stop:702 length:396 start_codon:yes stop_codon:yes gene_type:complete
MAINHKTGTGATVSFGGALANLLSISSAEMEREALDASDLSTTGYMKKIPAGLVDAGEVEVEMYYSGSIVDITGDADTLTVTFPAIGGGDAKALTGTAFCTSIGYPEAVNDDIMVTTATFTWDGDTAPAFS